MKTHKFDSGEYCEGYPWEIVEGDLESIESDFKKPCTHVIKTDAGFIVPRYVKAYNEGGCNITRVCLDCILEAVKKIEEENGKSGDPAQG